MLNSVAKYLWGSSSDAEQGPGTEDTALQSKQQQHQQQQDVAAVEGEHLDIHQDDDWVVVGLDGQDKENDHGNNSPHTPHHHHSPHPNPPHQQHFNPPHRPHQAQQAEANSAGGTMEAEALDEAASLVHRVGYANADGLEGQANLDLDSNYSSDTESSPDSVFSACSGRSHATYHPRGTSSEPWVIAPPPCFTGSQVGTLSPVAASPLENLLIEHPSMSVYLSVPASHPYLSNTSPTGEASSLSVEPSIEADMLTDRTHTPSSDPGLQVVGRLNTPAPPSTRPRTGVVNHDTAATIKAAARLTRAAQQIQCNKAQKMITPKRCEHQNKVHDINSHPKGKSNNRRNKCRNASGAKSSRNSQRV